MGYPDWENPVSLPNGKTEINEDGWVFWGARLTTTKSATFYLNGQLMSTLANDATNSYTSENYILVPVKKGDIVQRSGSVSYFKFYPNIK